MTSKPCFFDFSEWSFLQPSILFQAPHQNTWSEHWHPFACRSCSEKRWLKPNVSFPPTVLQLCLLPFFQPSCSEMKQTQTAHKWPPAFKYNKIKSTLQDSCLNRVDQQSHTATFRQHKAKLMEYILKNEMRFSIEPMDFMSYLWTVWNWWTSHCPKSPFLQGKRLLFQQNSQLFQSVALIFREALEVINSTPWVSEEQLERSGQKRYENTNAVSVLEVNGKRIASK